MSCTSMRFFAANPGQPTRALGSWLSRLGRIACVSLVACEPGPAPAREPALVPGLAPKPGASTQSPATESESSKGGDLGASPLPAKPTDVAAQEQGPSSAAFDETRPASVGQPTNGSLRDAVQLPPRAVGLIHHPGKQRERAFASPHVVAALLRAAGAVESSHPGSQLTVGDLSLAQGGDLPGHASHQNGRDVDLMFYLLDAEGQPRLGHPIPLDPAGEGTDYRDLSVAQDDLPVRIDLDRTWAFLAALLSDPKALVQRILIVEHLRAMLLATAERNGAAAELRQRFAEITCQPKFAHDDHMHVRFFCSAAERKSGCDDVWPIYPWHVDRLRKAGVRGPIEAVKARRSTPAKVTTPAQAREKARAAGPLHPDVVDFLDRRKSWAKRPRPGRPYCK